MAWYVLPREAPYARSALGWDGTDFRVLHVDAAGNVQVDVLASSLPTGAATAANQVTQITALQLIDDLRNALQSVNTDAVQVRGEDQLFSYRGVYQERGKDSAAPAGSVVKSLAVVPANEVWVVTNLLATDTTSAITSIRTDIHDGVNPNYIARIMSPSIGVPLQWATNIYLVEGDRVQFVYEGVVLNDTLLWTACGYKMSVE